MFRMALKSFALLGLGAIIGCSSAATKSPEVSDSIRKGLDQSSLKDVSVSQDRDKGVVTLGGHVESDAEKAQAESIAKSYAGSQVVADEIAVTPRGVESDAKTVNADLDKAIEKNLDAALLEARLNKAVRYSVKNGVITLKGSVNSDAKRDRAETIASKIPNAAQVVNELEVTDMKATSSK